MDICQVVGYKNSGKTTLMNALLAYFSKEGIQIGSLKHHGHGGEPSFVSGTDSSQHMESGSVISGVQGENMTQLNLRVPIAIDKLVNLYSNFQLDMLLIEGYKKAPYPKIVLVRNKADLSLLDELSNILAVGSFDQEVLYSTDYFTFHMNDLTNVIPQLAVNIRR